MTIIDLNSLLGLGIFIISLIGLVGFLWTKKPGFGKFNTSTLLLLMVVSISSLLFVSNRLDDNTMENLIFAIIGFAGGLFTGREDKSIKEKSSNDTKKYSVSVEEQK